MNYPKLNYSLSRARTDMVTLLFLAVSVVLFAIFASYSSSDPGWTHTNSASETVNVGGVVGAYVADIGYWIFGYAVLFVPVGIALFGWNYQYRWKKQSEDQLLSPLLFLSGAILTLVGGSGVENIYVSQAVSNTAGPPGGVLGSLTVQGVSAYLPWEATAVAFLAMLVAGMSLVGVPLMSIAGFTGKAIFFAFRSIRPSDKDEQEVIDSPSIQESSEIASPSQLRSSFKRFATRANLFEKRAADQDRKSSRSSSHDRIEPVLGSIDVPDDERANQEVAVAPPLFDKTAEVVSKKPSAPRKAPARAADRSRSRFNLPKLSLLDKPERSRFAYSRKDIEDMSRKVEKMLGEFGVEVEVKNAHPGPVITQLEVLPAAGVKASQIVNLARDLARSLSVSSVRVVDNIPGSPYVGIEVPNRTREVVRLFDGLESDQYKESNSPLSIVLGKDIRGTTVVSSLDSMPHVLIAGTTGAGKSVCLNAILLSFLYKSTPEAIRLIMVDPKMLEFSVYDGIPHLLTPVITDMEKTENALRWCIAEMEMRYELMSKLGVRNVVGFNNLVKSSTPIPNPVTGDGQETSYLEPLPYIVVVVDELADLIMVMGRKAEDLIIRIAQRARAAGIHLIVATQRPSTDVIKGLLKANIPTRIGFKVASNADSRTILDQPGAESLLGQGDMLFIPPGTSDVMRVHGAFVSDDEVKRVVDHLKKIGTPNYVEDVITCKPSDGTGSGFTGTDSSGEDDELYDKAVEFVMIQRKPTISSVQRYLRIGYNRAARIIEAMEHAGLVSPADSSGRREVLVPPPQD